MNTKENNKPYENETENTSSYKRPKERELFWDFGG